ncbi:MAG: HAD hydrolase-like protein [Ruminococcus sp.]|nr:HAD hydrolase-like protein [Ruminococcus sp.]
MAKYDYVLFDFDGTLSQSAEGVRLSLEKTIEKMGKPIPDLSDYSKYLGPPLVNTLKNLCGFSEDECNKGIEIYKGFYKTEGIKKNRLYDGMEEVLKTLNANNIPISVCSSKYELFAEKACDILDITKYFKAVCGSSKDGSRKEKADLIPYAVNRLGGKMTDKIVLIGDTYFDAEGARLTGIDFIAASYGYGEKSLMKKHGAKVFVNNPLEILDIMFTPNTD